MRYRNDKIIITESGGRAQLDDHQAQLGGRSSVGRAQACGA